MISTIHFHCEEPGCYNKIGSRLHDDNKKKGKKDLCFEHNIESRRVMPLTRQRVEQTLSLLIEHGMGNQASVGIESKRKTAFSRSRKDVNRSLSPLRDLEQD